VALASLFSTQIIRSHPVTLFIGEISKVLFADTKYLGLAFRTRTLRGWPAVLHFDNLGIADLHFLTALHTISLHSYLLH
jgi:hypothetical protein